MKIQISTFMALFVAVTLGLADERMPLFEISDDVPVGTPITTGATLGFLEYLGIPQPGRQPHSVAQPSYHRGLFRAGRHHFIASATTGRSHAN